MRGEFVCIKVNEGGEPKGGEGALWTTLFSISGRVRG